MSGVDLQTTSLSEEERQRFQNWLDEFEREWDEARLAVRVAQLPVAETSLRRSLLVGMVRIDLRRRWQQGQSVTVENYLGDYPELGTPETVAPELILEEYEARCRHGVPAERAEFSRRFPDRTEQLWLHLEQTRELATPVEAGLGTQATTQPAAFSAPYPRKTPATLPEQFGRYRIVRELGRGGMGTVYLAHDTQLDRLVALKVPHFIEDAPIALERFYREARVAATLDHPNLCPIHDVGQHEGIHYLTMPYIEGKPLSESLRASPHTPQRQIAALVRQLALALEEAHCRGIIHRDLKPSNIMMNRRGEPVVMDFGLARQPTARDARLTQSGTILGTPAYMPPEQVDGATTLLGPRCDIYSLGVILYELLTGRLPFQGGTTQVLCQILRDEPRRPSVYRPDLEPRLEAICQKAMAKRINERYRSMADLAAALEQFLQAPESPEVFTLELVQAEEKPPAPPVQPRKESEQEKRASVSAAPLLEALPADPLPAVPRRRRRWPKVLLGCLTVSLLCCGGPILLLTILMPKVGEKIKDGFHWVGGEITRQSEWNSLGTRWQAPPADVSPQELFPTRVGEFERGPIGLGVPLSQHNIDTTGRKTTYRRRGQEVELYALRSSSLEREALFKCLLDSIEKRSNGRRIVQGDANSYRLTYSLGPPNEKGMLWWNQGWLFIAFTRDTVDVEAFLRTYLDMISR
ncbi:MAG TPA: serine/threonine-protein kinase [Gemmataceae bacterium]|jgi:serine/threonine protein kinase